MNLEVYYLHSCARTSASWLKDSDVMLGVVQSLRILSTAVAYQTCETDTLLPGPFDIREPHVQWAMQSAHNYQWVLSYYLSLCDFASCVDTAYKPIAHRVKNRLQSCAVLFPDELFCPPPFLYDKEYIGRTTEESYRAWYRSERKSSGYRRMSIPFWFRQGHSVKEHHQPHEPEEYEREDDLDDDPLADLR